MPMYKIYSDISKIACIFCIVLFWGGCDSTPEPPKTAQVVSKKIVVAKQKATQPAPTRKTAPPPAKITPAAPALKPAAKAAAPAPPKPAVAPAPPKPAVAKASPVAPAPKKDTAPKAEADTSAPKMPPPAPVPAAEESKTEAAPAAALLVSGYDPAGKIDPFLPLYKDEPVAAAKVEKKVKRRLPLTPLEKVDLSQLKLVGIIRAPSGNKGMVEEASGKGYIVKKGTYIGIRAGRVIEILKDRLIVLEEVETALGTYELQKRELTIQKPPGEM